MREHVPEGIPSNGRDVFRFGKRVRVQPTGHVLQSVSR